MKDIPNQYISIAWADPEGGGGRRSVPPPEKSQKIGFLSNTDPDSLKDHKATKPEFNVGPSSARQRNAIKMAFRWRADDGPPLVVFGSSLLSPTNKTLTILDPL